MQVPPLRERTQRFQSQAYRSRAMWPCCDITSSDDDEHNTDNNFLLLFADVDITLTLLEGLSEVDVLHIALGCRFALDIFTISQQLSSTPDHEPLPLDAEFATLCGLVPHTPYGGHDGRETWTTRVERDSHSKPHSVLSDLAVTLCQLQSTSHFALAVPEAAIPAPAPLAEAGARSGSWEDWSGLLVKGTLATFAASSTARPWRELPHRPTRS